MIVSSICCMIFGQIKSLFVRGAIPMKTMFKLISIFALLARLTAGLQAQEEAAARPAKAQDNSSKDPLENMKFRNLGPAVGGGRATTVVGIPGKPNVYYAGSAGGGVWMTQDGGLSWKAVFEKESPGSICAIALAPSHPNLGLVSTDSNNLPTNITTS